MASIVIAEFPARSDTVEAVGEALRQALPVTRAYDGCQSLVTWFEPDSMTYVLFEDWASFDHYDRYLEWRMETGLAELLEPLLDGGAAAFRVRKLHATDI